jgi:5-methylcytosine-specific restriction endonuclease McrA
MPRFSDEYLAYINSREWYKRRAGRLIAAGFACERCGCGEWLQVHHKHYRNLGHEPPEDLEVLCVACHRKITDQHDESI